jgi:hypothetical protein
VGKVFTLTVSLASHRQCAPVKLFFYMGL